MTIPETSTTFASGYTSPIESVDVAQLLREAHDLPGSSKDAALGLARRALSLARDGAADGDHLDVALCWHWVGRHALALGRLDEAEHAFREELAILDRIVEADHVTRAQSLDFTARALRSAGRLDEAVQLYRESLAMRRRIFHGTAHPDLAGSLNNLALAEAALGHYSEAETLYVESLEMKRAIYSSDDVDVATTINNLGNLLIEQGRLMEAIQRLSEGVAMLLNAAGEQSQNPVVPAGLAALARAYRVAGLYDQALRLAEDVLRRRKSIYPGDHPAIASAQADLGRLYWKNGRGEAGIGLLRESLAMHNRLFPSGHSSLASSMFELGRVLAETDSLDEAEALLFDGLAMLKRTIGEDHQNSAVAMVELARVKVRLAKCDEAALLLAKAAPILDNGRDHPFTVIELRAHAELAERMGDPAAAVEYFRRAVSMLERIFPHGHPDRAAILEGIASLQMGTTS